MPTPRTAYCVFINTLCEGSVPSIHDGEGQPCVFTSRLEAEREIADNLMTRLEEFTRGQRDLDDAIYVEEYVVEVEMSSDGSIWLPKSENCHYGLPRCAPSPDADIRHSQTTTPIP